MQRVKARKMCNSTLFYRVTFVFKGAVYMLKFVETLKFSTSTTIFVSLIRFRILF